MDPMSVIILWLSITYAMEEDNNGDVVAILGCNVTLEWILGTTYWESFAHSITVINSNGHKIAEKKDMTCRYWIDSSMYCEIRNTSNKEWRFVVVLFNVTQSSSGNYTGEIKYGARKEIHSTIHLKVLEKPNIKEVQTSILHKPLRISCSVEGEFKNLSYYWKLNGTYLNSTDRMDITSSNLTCVNLTMADTWNIFSCSACSDSKCCIESETYVPDPYYGPESVTLSVNDSDIYLNANETFKINCSAKCNPPCTFVWNGYVSSQNEELLINNFDSRMAGTYSCITTNAKTGITVKSKTISLHYVQDSSRTSSSLRVNGGSLLNILGIGLFSAAVPLITVGVYLVHTNRRKYAARKLVLYSRYHFFHNSQQALSTNHVDTHRQMVLDRHDIRTLSLLYSLVAVLSVYDYARDNADKGNSNATRTITEHSLYDYAIPIETCRVEVADIHVTFENYITPVHDSFSHTAISDNGEINLLETDRTDVITSSDFAHSVSGINVLDSDHTYITPII
ncbi:hypothetical protein ACJMK2_026035 [Sinanodonta woodiana]|uniref:Ig-like domain-containing protein n=1 Tax=Sinanodonta woodiana TaxID=1069815 RepID=A0ABD3XIC5_SINWO